MNIIIRRAEPDDYEALYKIYSCPRVIWGTLQLPFPSKEVWHKRLAENESGKFSLVALVEAELVGYLGLKTDPSRPRRRHAGGLEWQCMTTFEGAALERPCCRPLWIWPTTGSTCSGWN